MDVLKPELQWLDGICYRINNAVLTNPIEQPYYEQDDTACPLEIVDDDIDDDYDIEEDKGRLKCSFHVAQDYFAYLNGTKGATKKHLEIETRTQINIPKPGRDGDIIVYGVSRKNVALAISKIQLMVRRVKKKATQFVSLPLCSPSIRERFLAFKASVLENCKDAGIDETIFIHENKLHLTVIALVILDDFEINEAAKVLRSCKDTVIEPLLKNRPLKIEMNGIECMNDDPSKVDVLYSNVTSSEDPNLLQTIANGISDAFKNSKTKTESTIKTVKIHATLMNSIYRKPKAEGTRIPFDATNIFQKYGDFAFGEGVVSRIDISILGSECPKTGYYVASSSIDLQ